MMRKWPYTAMWLTYVLISVGARIVIASKNIYKDWKAYKYFAKYLNSLEIGEDWSDRQYCFLHPVRDYCKPPCLIICQKRWLRIFLICRKSRECMGCVDRGEKWCVLCGQERGVSAQERKRRRNLKFWINKYLMGIASTGIAQHNNHDRKSQIYQTY